MMNKSTVFLHKISNLLVCKRLKWTSKNTQLFSELFEMSTEQCTRYKHNKKIPPLDEKRIRATADLRERLNISVKDWLRYPILIKELAYTLEQQYKQLKEGGFVKVDAEILANYRKCVRKNITFLKSADFIPEDANVAKNFASHLATGSIQLPIDDLTDDNTFENIHHSILTRYLMWKCNASEDVIKKFCRVYTLSKVKSFNTLSQNFAIAEKLGFPPQKVMKYGYLLTVNPKHTERALSEIPVLASVSMRKAMKMIPRLIGTSPEKIMEVYNYLKSENIPDETIARCISIFTLSPTIVKCRFEEIKAIPEIKVLFNNPYILKLIVHHNQARSRLSFLQKIKLKCATTSMLNSQMRFSSHIHEGRDYNSQREILLLLKNLLDIKNAENLTKNLKKHCYYLNVPLVDIEKNYKLLKKLNFTNQSIADVIQVILYPGEKIQNAFNELSKIDHVPYQNISEIEKLNLMLYIMEKEHHFTGNGIWQDDSK